MRSLDREGGFCLSTTKTRGSMTRWSEFCALRRAAGVGVSLRSRGRDRSLVGELALGRGCGALVGPVDSSTARMCIAFIAASFLASSASASAMASLMIFVEKSSDDEALFIVVAIGAVVDSSAFCPIQLLSRQVAIVFLDIALSAAGDEFANFSS